MKRIALWRFNFDVGVTRAWKRRPSFVLGGECGRCARCCEAPGIKVSWLTWYLPTLRAAFLGWQQHVNGFLLVSRDVPGRTFVFRCTHFDAVTRVCDSYDSRPGMCRDYPRLLLDQPSPEMLPGCGYRPLAANAQGLIRVLARAPLTDAQRERLHRDLNLH